MGLDRRSADVLGWKTPVRRLGAVPRPLVLTGALLGLAAVSEAIVRAIGTGVLPAFVLVLCLLAAVSTTPVALLPPVPAAVVVGGACVVSVVPFQSLTIAGAAAQLIVLYQLGRGGRQLLAAVLAAPYLVLALSDTAQQTLTLLLASLGPATALVGAWRRSRADALAAGAALDLIDGTLLEHTVRGERARIARELHDVVAHHISMISIQAESARLTTAGMPAAGAQRLSAIGDTARTALTEMRRLLGVLREDPSTDSFERQPQPGLRQLNELVDQTRAVNGAGARLILRGAPNPLDAGAELAAYRIVQEALTNARRHAPGSAVDVELHYVDDTLRLRIRDNGPGDGVASWTGGLGRRGMAERATAVGGSLHSGPASGGGFLVEAVLPVKNEMSP